MVYNFMVNIHFLKGNVVYKRMLRSKVFWDILIKTHDCGDVFQYGGGGGIL